jgi:hypothetical protein
MWRSLFCGHLTAFLCRRSHRPTDATAAGVPPELDAAYRAKIVTAMTHKIAALVQCNIFILQCRILALHW